MEVKGSEPQGRHREVEVWRKREANARAEGHEPDERRERRASGQRIAKPISIKGAERKFGGGVRTAVELIAGGLCRVRRTGLSVSRGAHDRGAEVSRGRSKRGRRSTRARHSPERGETVRARRTGNARLKVRTGRGSVGHASHERQATENPAESGLRREGHG